ncbi:MAG: acyltransferase domain-containing protein [Symploca sp. SIO3E6]|nr:acyltransferase domain-containing protein [Caldora sp. SIO3E6]
MVNSQIGEQELEGIAIIGIAGRFPDAPNIDQFWDNLKNGVESVSFFSDEELEASGISPELFRKPNYVRGKAVLEGTDLFDASFFDYSPREAALMDPQHRIFLECASEALENSGYDPERFPGWIGVYGSAARPTYWQKNLLYNPNLGVQDEGSIFIGNSLGFLSTRVSFKLNLKGPSMDVQTSCSTSLVAVNLACQSLLTYQCDIALAGGVTVSVPQKVGYLYQEGSVVSADGHCRPFDAEAGGIVPGNGVGIVVLKRLEEALADGDTIHAVIKGIALNNDGSLKMSYSAPSRDGQAEAILMAQQMAEVAGDDIGYIETHGTGTELGDPIEIGALTKAFRETTDRKGFCAIGSLKSNLGHLDAAAGIGGLIKTVLILKHQQIPPSLNCQTPNPAIDFANSPFFVNTKLTEWKTAGERRRAGVSAFGIGGTNAHTVLEEAPSTESSPSRHSYQLLVLSAKTESALEMATANLVSHLRQNSQINFPDVAYTLQVGRRIFNHRRILVCSDANDAINALDTSDPNRLFTSYYQTTDRPVVFMFSGGGTQYVNMGLGIYQEEPLFREQVDRCAQILEGLMGYDIRQLLFPQATETESACQKMEQVSQALPILFSVEYAMAKLWMSWGIQPQLMIGHSLGEYVAACIAGVFSLEDALAVIVERSKLMAQVEPGTMLSVPLSEAELLPLLGDDIAIAAINSPNLCVVSGVSEAIDLLRKKLEEKQINYRPLHIQVASHSPCIAPILEDFDQFLRQIPMQPPTIPFISNVTGTYIKSEEATDPNYWCTHLRQTVRFAKGLEEIFQGSDRIFLEVGPGNNLSTLARQHPQKSDSHDIFSSLRHPKALDSDQAFLLNTIGRLWLSGVSLDWTRFYDNEVRQRIPLPTYPFERQSYHIEPYQGVGMEIEGYPQQASKKRKSDLAEWFYIPSWQRTLPLAPLQPASLVEQSQCWLVFGDRDALGMEMVRRLQSENQDVIPVLRGEQFTVTDDGYYCINPERREDYLALIKELKAAGKCPTQIFNFWNLTVESSPNLGKEVFEKAQSNGYYSLIYLVQAWHEHNLEGNVTIAVVSNQIQNVLGTETLSPEKSTLLGPCQVIPQEYQNFTCISVDLSVPETPAEQNLLIGQLLAEMRLDSPQTIVAYRNRQRFVRTFENVRLKEAGATVRPLRERGVYLITGGLGRIGLMLAKYLAETLQAKLVLVGQSTLPERSQWEDWLENHDSNDKISRKLRSLLELEAMGADYQALTADITDEMQMRSLLTQIKEKFGEVNGVFHAAAITSNKALLCSIAQLGVEESTLQFAPKVFGLYVLEKVLAGEKLDFCILLSSNASILGGLGFCAYAAANHFLDFFAADRSRRDNIPWISTNWDRWLLNEQERQEAKGTSMDTFAMIPQESLEAMKRIITQALAEQVVITSGYLSDRLNIWIQRQFKQDIGELKEPEKEASPSQARRNLQTPYRAPSNDMEKTIAQIWQELLGIEQVGIYDNFFELGGHSLLAIQLMSRLHDIYQVKLPLRKLFEVPTITGLGDLISEKLTEDLSEDNLEELLAGLENLTEEEVAEKLKSES